MVFEGFFAFFFFPLWWLFLAVVVGGWSGCLSCGFAQIGDGFGVWVGLVISVVGF